MQRSAESKNEGMREGRTALILTTRSAERCREGRSRIKKGGTTGFSRICTNLCFDRINRRGFLAQWHCKAAKTQPKNGSAGRKMEAEILLTQGNAESVTANTLNTKSRGFRA